MKVGDLVTIRRHPFVDVGSLWFRETQKNGTTMLIVDAEEDELVSSEWWRYTLVHPSEGVVLISGDHLEVVDPV